MRTRTPCAIPCFAIACALCTLGAPAHAESNVGDSLWRFEIALGDAYDAHTRLRIKQSGGYSERVSAHYSTHPFESPQYYAWRVARWQDDRGWELQLIHHKLFLNNPPTGVQRLSITHGFNMITVNRAYERGDWTMRFGLGPVVTHLEARVNDIAYDGPYNLCGAVALAGVSRRFHATRSIFLKAEILGTVGYARPQSAGARDLKVSVLDAAIHAQLGVGFDL